MPIVPDKMPLYPGGSTTSPEWREIRARIQQRAGDACEGCGIRNGAVGVRLVDRSFLELEGYAAGDVVTIDYCAIGALPAWQRLELRVFRIVCTVAHVDGALVDHSDGNLRFWCQQCHNAHDGRRRAENAARTRAARRPRTLLDWMAG